MTRRLSFRAPVFPQPSPPRDRAPLLMVSAVVLSWAVLVGVFFVLAAITEMVR